MIRALLITTISAALAYAACDGADPLNRQPGATTDNQPRRTTTMIQTRTVYRLRIQETTTGALLAEPSGPLCESPELAKAADLITQREEVVVLVKILQRLGGDGCWHTTDETVTEVL